MKKNSEVGNEERIEMICQADCELGGIEFIKMIGLIKLTEFIG